MEQVTPITVLGDKKPQPLIYRNCGKAAVNKQEKGEDVSHSRLAELPDEIWVEIMWKLPIKPLHKCKCVSKTWHSNVSHILASQKGIEPPCYGLLFWFDRYLVDFYEPDWDVEKPTSELGFVSLGDRNVTKWSIDENTKSATVEITDHKFVHNTTGLLLGNITLDFGCITSNGKQFWTLHRGLVLFTLHDTITFHVYNPATRQVFVVPTSPFLAEWDPTSKPRISRQASIINLSDCLLSTQCNFKVFRYFRDRKTGRGLVEVFSSNKLQWFQSEFRLKRVVFLATWSLCTAVFVENTLFFLTDKRHAVGVKLFPGDQVSVYSLRLPRRKQKGLGYSKLHASQGCLYLSHEDLPNLWIWKHNGSSVYGDAWIPQLVFKKSGISLCQPVAEKYLRTFMADINSIGPRIAMDPEAPVVYLYVRPSIFAFHLLNDTVEKISEMTEREFITEGFGYTYSPCFASLECLKPENHS